MTILMIKTTSMGSMKYLKILMQLVETFKNYNNALTKGLIQNLNKNPLKLSYNH